MVKATNGGKHEVWKLPFRPIVVALNIMSHLEKSSVVWTFELQDMPMHVYCISKVARITSLSTQKRFKNVLKCFITSETQSHLSLDVANRKI